jgi:uncharacterized delta-60 repeat protein
MAIFRFGKVYSSNYFCSEWKAFRLRCRHEGQHPTNLDGKLYPGAVLLNPNGSVDSNFHKTLFKHLDRILSMAVRKDEIAVYGLNGNIRLLLKFKIDGSLDTSFKKSILTPEQGSSSGRDIFYLSDGRLIHRRTDTTTWRESLYIFKSDGTKDKSFILDNEVQLNGLSQIIEQKDGKILLFGALYTLSDLSYNGILRLNPDGSLDKTFTIPIQLKDNLLTNVRSALIQRDNKILLCGSFNGFDENFRIFLLRLNQDGSLDKSFVIKDAFNFTVFEIANYYNGKVLVSGIFDSYGSFITGRIARVNILNQDDSQIYVFPNPNNGIFNVDAQREITLVVVTDILGREVYRYVPSNPNIEIDISDKAKGTYFLSIFSTDQRNVKKIMKL